MAEEIKEVLKKDIWEGFLKNKEHLNILSSWEWIEFEKSLGFDTKAYSFLEKGCFAFRTVNSKKGKFLILKQNVFIDWENEKDVKGFVSFLKQESIKKGCSFFRISPPLICDFEREKFLQKYGFKNPGLSPTDAQFTVFLDLNKSEENILKEMRKNTRYLIRRGEKMELEVLNTKGGEFLKDFEKVFEETKKRHAWNGEGFDYIKKQYEFFSKRGLSRMFVVRNGKKEVLACSVFTKFQNQVIYHHSGSVSRNDVPAMYVLLWEAIKYYKGLGLKEFNFFGVCKKNDLKHPWYGLSLFKRGFSDNERVLMSSHDYPVSPKYSFFRVLENLSYFKNRY